MRASAGRRARRVREGARERHIEVQVVGVRGLPHIYRVDGEGRVQPRVEDERNVLAVDDGEGDIARVSGEVALPPGGAVVPRPLEVGAAKQR